MKLTANKNTALQILRHLRSQRFDPRTVARTDLVPPDPSPCKRWSIGNLDLKDYGAAMQRAGGRAHGNWTVDVAVPSRDARVRSVHVSNTVYSTGLPAGSFLDIDGSLSISCPELLFVEMATLMQPPEHLMLGHELCGGFARDATDPVNGPVIMNIPAATSAERIARFIDGTWRIPGTPTARKTLSVLSDSAWSPTESVVAMMMALPFSKGGYELAPVVLNERIPTPLALSTTTDKTSRVPDILVAGTHMGINYDGTGHLDLDSVVEAAMQLERDPGQLALQRELDDVLRSVREKAVDDIRRNRELAADGYTVFPVVKEDLYMPGGLDCVVLQLAEAIENHKLRDMTKHRRMLADTLAASRRQRLIWSVLPGTSRIRP